MYTICTSSPLVVVGGLTVGCLLRAFLFFVLASFLLLSCFFLAPPPPSSPFHRSSQSYPILTLGIPAAHPLGFRRGGLLRLQEDYMHMRRTLVTSQVNADVEDMQRMESLGIEIDQRKDMVLAQCTAALVGSFIATCQMYTPDDNHATHHANHNAVGREWWNSTLRSGYLLHVETVLHDSKKDQCLLEDFIIGARALEKYFIKIVDYSSGGGAEANVDIKHINAAQGSTTGGQGHLQINLFLGSNFPFSRLPEAIQRGALIPVKTTVFAHCPTSVPLANVSVCWWWLVVVGGGW